MPTFTLATRVQPDFTDAELQWNGKHICQERGYHGPFANEDLYDHFGGMWSGQGDCMLCWNTRNVREEEIRQAIAEHAEAA
jgi:hypothetical protein